MREGLERMKAAARGTTDRIPVYAQMSHHAARLMGETTYRFYTDPQVFLNCELYGDELYGFDAPTIHYDCYNIEIEAMGADLIFSEHETPAVNPRTPLLHSADDLSGIGQVRMGKSGRMPFVLEINRRLVDLGLAPKVRFCGIFTMSARLLGYEKFMSEIMERPKAVHRLMRYLTDEIIAPWIACQRLHCDSDITATGSEALASPPLLTLDMIDEFCLQYVRRLEGNIGKIRLAGLWGESLVKDPVRFLDMKREFSGGMIQVCDPDATELSPAFFKSYADEHDVGLIMGLDAGLILSGPILAIQARTNRFIEEAGMNGRFVFFINDIPYNTPPEHVQAAVSAARGHRSRTDERSTP
jgi:uroporphyrinogen-III decarboxylase